jgi:hypothetical protein
MPSRASKPKPPSKPIKRKENEPDSRQQVKKGVSGTQAFCLLLQRVEAEVRAKEFQWRIRVCKEAGIQGIETVLHMKITKTSGIGISRSAREKISPKQY